MKELLANKYAKIVIVAVVIIFIGSLIYFFTRSTNAGKSYSAKSQKEMKSPFAKGAEERFAKAHEFLKAQKLDEALKEFDEAAKLSPKTPVIYYWLGIVYFSKKDPENAIVNFKKVLDLEPKNYHAIGMIGKILSFDKNKLDEAIDQLNAALAINPDFAEAHFDLGRIYALKGDMTRSMAEFGVILRNEPQYAIYHFELGRIFESMKTYDRAKNEYRRALQLNPNMAVASEALKKLEK
jgi:protein O-GlcNAc transferase